MKAQHPASRHHASRHQAPGGDGSALRPLDRRSYLAWGIFLFAIKIGIDWAISHAFGMPYSIFFYVSPTDAPLFRPNANLPYWTAMVAAALPFVAAGLFLTARRLAHAGLPRWLLAFFFVPFANLVFFLACTLVPGAPKPQPDVNYRESAQPHPAPEPSGKALLMSGAAGACVALGTLALAVGVFRDYGASLFIGAPALCGFFANVLLLRLKPDATKYEGIGASLMALAISLAVVVGFALEGLICLMMAAPLATGATIIGGLVAFAVMRAPTHPGMDRPHVHSAILVVPLMVAAEQLSPLPERDAPPVESSIEIDAPPSAVWPSVVAFPELSPPREWFFRAGVAYPTGATIDGEGVGAVRRCRFTTGEFIEPIEIWKPGKHLAFGVRSQPPPMREWTWIKGVRPPHLDGYLKVSRGEFLLRARSDGGTRLIGRTYYRVNIMPRAYFRWWSDYMIHRIHMRVLEQVRRHAESRIAAHPHHASKAIFRAQIQNWEAGCSREQPEQASSG